MLNTSIKRTIASAACAAAIVAGTAAPAFAAATTIQCEDMNAYGQYASKYVQSGQFNGATLYANDDTLSFTQYFANNAHDFKLRGRSTTDAQGQVDLYIGSDFMGSFFYKGQGTWEAPLANVARTQHMTGNQEVKLICKNDNGTWDLELDYLVIDNGRNEGNNGQQNWNNGQQNWNNGQQNQNWNNGQQNNGQQQNQNRYNPMTSNDPHTNYEQQRNADNGNDVWQNYQNDLDAGKVQQ